MTKEASTMVKKQGFFFFLNYYYSSAGKLDSYTKKNKIRMFSNSIYKNKLRMD